MDVRALDEDVLRLRGATERIGANLLALEEDPTAALLTVADLTGATAVRWSAARDGDGRAVPVLHRAPRRRGPGHGCPR